MKTIGECLADELMNAAKGSSHRWAHGAGGSSSQAGWGRAGLGWAVLCCAQHWRNDRYGQVIVLPFPSALFVRACADTCCFCCCLFWVCCHRWSVHLPATVHLISYAIKKKDEIERVAKANR